MKKSGELSPYALAYFDGEGGEMLLYELRFLSIRQRAQAAQYIADNELSAQVWLLHGQPGGACASLASVVQGRVGGPAWRVVST